MRRAVSRLLTAVDRAIAANQQVKNARDLLARVAEEKKGVAHITGEAAK